MFKNLLKGISLKKALVVTQSSDICSSATDIRRSQNDFDKASNNLYQLLKSRYNWIQKQIPKGGKGMELGAGAGLSKHFIKDENFKISDFNNESWLDYKNIDALKTGFDNESFDYVCCNFVVHHIATPTTLFKEMHRILKKDGLFIIQDVHLSFFMRILINIVKHEGYSYDVDVFDKKALCNDPNDPWSGNNAVADMLWGDVEKFEKNVTEFKVIHSSSDEFLCYLNSGGVIGKVPYIPLPVFVIRIMQLIDKVLTSTFPNLFALRRNIVLKKR